MKLTNRDTEESIEFTWNSKQDLIDATNKISQETDLNNRRFKVEGFWDNDKAVEEVSNLPGLSLETINQFGTIFLEVDVRPLPLPPPHVKYSFLLIHEVGQVLFM